MFERRLIILLAFFGGLVLVWVGRIAQLQALHGARYAAEAERLLVRPKEYIPAARGAILDRTGRRLAYDEPCWDICIDYGLLRESQEHDDHPKLPYDRHLKALAQAWHLEDLDNPRTAEAFEHRLDVLWQFIADLGDTSVEDLKDRRDRIIYRVEAIKYVVETHHDYDVTVREELMHHAIAPALGDQQAIEAKMKLASLPGITVQTSTRRNVVDHPAWSHVIGRLGQVNNVDVENDPLADDEYRRLLPSERAGHAGLERLLEVELRGARGTRVEDREGVVIEKVDPLRGGDVHASIDGELQEQVYQILGDAIRSDADGIAVGGAAVVLDIDSREVLALVSYPGYRYSDRSRDYESLLRDTKQAPLRFRAVQSTYPPGSPCKAPTLIAALTEGECTLNTVIECRGYLFDEVTTAWRCWRPSGSSYPMTHGLMGPADSIKNSCNIFYYTMGGALGAPRLTEWFYRFGIGRKPGTGLMEERSGILPTPQWLWQNRQRRPRPGDGRNYALGQGEVTVTPLHQANLMATLASGVYQSPTLIANDPRQRLVEKLPVRPEHWAVLRDGLWMVVNEERGTAYKSINFRSDDFDLFGKSGSAQSQPMALAYEVRFNTPDGAQVETVRTDNGSDARKTIKRRHDLENEDILSCTPSEWWPAPPGGEHSPPSHAWFVAYLQPRIHGRRGNHPTVAISVLVEYGGSGGGTAGPVAGDIARHIIEAFPDYARGVSSARLVSTP